jgi:hypothetical protein
MSATTTTDTVLATLEQRPDTTTVELAAAAGLGRSTVGKALAALDHATVAGGRRRRAAIALMYELIPPDMERDVATSLIVTAVTPR